MSSLGKESKKIHIVFFQMCGRRNSITDFVRQNDIFVVAVHIFFPICFLCLSSSIRSHLLLSSFTRLALQVEKVRKIGKKKNSKKMKKKSPRI